MTQALVGRNTNLNAGLRRLDLFSALLTEGMFMLSWGGWHGEWQGRGMAGSSWAGEQARPGRGKCQNLALRLDLKLLPSTLALYWSAWMCAIYFCGLDQSSLIGEIAVSTWVRGNDSS